jgi:cell wall-associated NlpC family hydrolase
MARKNAPETAATEEPRPAEAAASAEQKPERAEIKAAKELANSLVGKPWKAGADGPDAFDCYGLVRHVRRELFADDLPELGRPAEKMTLSQARMAFLAATQPAGWMPIPGPKHGAVVLLGRVDRPAHAGIFLAVGSGPGRILHCDEEGGVMFETLSHLQARGWQRARWYAPVGAPATEPEAA